MFRILTYFFMITGASYFRLVTKIIPGVATAGGNTGTEFSFADQPDIRYARLQGMVFLTDQDMSIAQPETAPLVSAAQIGNISFVFETNDPDDFPKTGGKPGEKSQGNDGRFGTTLNTIEWIPASLLHINQGTGLAGSPSFVRQMIQWKDRYIIWQKSKIKWAPGGPGNTTDIAVCLAVFYTFTNSQGGIISPRN